MGGSLHLNPIAQPLPQPWDRLTDVSHRHIMHLHLDAVGGVAGDMFIAAVLDAFPDLREPHAQRDSRGRTAGGGRLVGVVEHRDHALTGLRFLVEDPPIRRTAARTCTACIMRTTRRRSREIRDNLQASALAAGGEASVRWQSSALLAEVEGKIHGTATDEVSFHELGGWDSIADIVGAAALDRRAARRRPGRCPRCRSGAGGPRPRTACCRCRHRRPRCCSRVTSSSTTDSPASA